MGADTLVAARAVDRRLPLVAAGVGCVLLGVISTFRPLGLFESFRWILSLQFSAWAC